jgi:DNA (cytosine-5)-methyltransferase 1
MIKTRIAKSSKRGIYLQDKELQLTNFKPGTHFKYVIDQKNKQVIILSSDEATNNTVSKRSLGEGTKPVIDIRNKEALSVFGTSDYLQVEIFENQVIVKAYQKTDESVLQKAVRKVKQKIFKSNIVDITAFASVKTKPLAVMHTTTEELSQVVGESFASYTIDLKSISSSAVHTKQALEKLRIPLQVASLFSGAGLMDMGFIDAGFKIIFALDFDPGAVASYASNLGKHIHCADISLFDKRFIPNAPIMIGGSPCQSFSNANRKDRFLMSPKNLLVREFIDAIKTNQSCKVFVLENVPQILTAGEGQFKDEIYDALSDFTITSGVLNSASFGTSQLRNRAIFIGSKIGKIELPKPSFLESMFRTVREAFRGITKRTPNQNDITKSKEETIDRIKFVPPGGNIFDIPEAIRPKGQHSDIYKRLEWDKPSITIVNPRKSMILHPSEHRILSIREAARLFGVRDDFIFKGTLSSKQQQIANGVPVPLAYAIANAIKKAIDLFNKKLISV